MTNWEAGGMPASPSRGKYLRLLEGLAQIHPAPQTAANPSPATTPPPANEQHPASPAAHPPTQAPAESAVARQARAGHVRHQARRRTSSADQVRSELREVIAAAVEGELSKAGGDADAAAGALVKRAIPDVMGLFARTRAQARYEYTAYPALPDILHKRRRPIRI